MGFPENTIWAVILGIISTVVAVLLIIIETGIGEAITSIFNWSADYVDSYGYNSTGDIIRAMPFIIFGVGVPLGLLGIIQKLDNK